MRLAPIYDAGSPFSAVADPAPQPAPAFPLAPFNALCAPLDLDPRGMGQLRFRAFPSPSTETTPAFGNYAKVGDLSHGSNTHDNNTPRFTSDTLVRPVLPRLTPWGDPSRGGGAETRKRVAEAEADAGPSKLYARQDFQVARDEPMGATDYEDTVKRPSPKRSAPTSPRKPDSPPARSKPVKTTRRREQCRANQARYRERQKLKVWIKEEEVACLRELVNLLEAQRSLKRVGSGREAFTQHVVVEWFRRFRNGLSGARVTDSTRSDALTNSSHTLLPMKWNMARHVERNLTFFKQIAFVRTVVAKDADVGDGFRGPDALLEQCWRYSTLHENLKLELLGVERERNSDLQTERVMVTGSLKVGVTEQTLTDVFPDLPMNLRRKLLGATLSYSLRLRLEFEEAAMAPLLQVTKLDAELDVLSGLLALLKEPADVERVMRYAQISPNGFIGELVGHPGRV